MKLPAKIALGVLGTTAGYFALTAGAYMPFVLADARKNYCDPCDYLLILGGDIIGADTPSPQLKERMKRAATYLRENPGVIAVPCGGCFRPLQKKSEAAIIADYLTAQGIAPNRIVLEDQSTTTFENFRFAAPIITRHSQKPLCELRIAFLTSAYHQHRAGIIAHRCGVNPVGRVSAPTPGKAWKRYVREYFVGYELLYRFKATPEFDFRNCIRNVMTRS